MAARRPCCRVSEPQSLSLALWRASAPPAVDEPQGHQWGPPGGIKTSTTLTSKAHQPCQPQVAPKEALCPTQGFGTRSSSKSGSTLLLPLVCRLFAGWLSTRTVVKEAAYISECPFPHCVASCHGCSSPPWVTADALHVYLRNTRTVCRPLRMALATTSVPRLCLLLLQHESCKYNVPVKIRWPIPSVQ